MLSYFEQELFRLISEKGATEEVANQLIYSLEGVPDNLTKENIDLVSKFLIDAGFYGTLCFFILRHIEDETFPIPWPFFLESIMHAMDDIPARLQKIIEDAIVDQKIESEASKAPSLEPLLANWQQWRRDRKYKIQKQYEKNKEYLIEHIETLRAQELFTQEKQLLDKLHRLYPNDDLIEKKIKAQKEQLAIETIARIGIIKESIITHTTLNEDPLIHQAIHAYSESIIKQSENNIFMAYDLAMVAYFFDAFETSLKSLHFAPNSVAKKWFELELLLKCRRFVDLLQKLNEIEVSQAHEPETFFATAYLRAQAYWGLGQKTLAIETLEALINARPLYRSATVLLNAWRKY